MSLFFQECTTNQKTSPGRQGEIVSTFFFIYEKKISFSVFFTDDFQPCALRLCFFSFSYLWCFFREVNCHMSKSTSTYFQFPLSEDQSEKRWLRFPPPSSDCTFLHSQVNTHLKLLRINCTAISQPLSRITFRYFSYFVTLFPGKSPECGPRTSE